MPDSCICLASFKAALASFRAFVLFLDSSNALLFSSKIFVFCFIVCVIGFSSCIALTAAEPIVVINPAAIKYGLPDAINVPPKDSILADKAFTFSSVVAVSSPRTFIAPVIDCRADHPIPIPAITLLSFSCLSAFFSILSASS